MASICVHARSTVGNSAPFAPRGKPLAISSPTPQVAVHAKLTQRQKEERIQLQSRVSEHGTPVVDWLLETSPYSQFLQPGAVDDLRDRERKIAHIEDIGERIRRLRIAIANKNRQPWNVGKKHSPETIKKIRDSIHKMVHDPAAVADRKKRAEAYQQQDPEKVKAARRKASESLRSRWGLQLHRRYGFKNGKRCQHALGHRAPTSASVFFHIHRGCSASVMIHHRTWKREMSWHKKPRKKKRTAPRLSRRRTLTEEERQERAERARVRKSLAQKQLWQDPEYRARQVQSIRAASGGRAGGGSSGAGSRKPGSPQMTVEQLQRAHRRSRQQLLQAQELVPQLEKVVEKLREKETSAGTSFAMEQEVRAALQTSEDTLHRARSTLESLRAEDASLEASFGKALKAAAQDDASESSVDGAAEDADTDTDTAASEHSEGDAANAPPAAPPPAEAAGSAGSPVRESEVAWPTAEQVQSSGAAWKDAEAQGAVSQPPQIGGNDEATSPPPPQNGSGHSDGPVHSRHHSFNGSKPSRGGWQGAAGLGSLAPHSPRHVNVRNGAGRQFAADDSDTPDTTATRRAPNEPVAGSGGPGGKGEAVPVRVPGFGSSGAGSGAANCAPHSDAGSGSHDSDSDANVLPSRDIKDERGNGGGAVDANGARAGGVGGAAFSHAVPVDQLRSPRYDAGSNGHVLQNGNSTPEEGRSDSGAKLNAGAGGAPPAQPGDPPAAALDAGSDEDEESWLKKRKHRLPWQ